MADDRRLQELARNNPNEFFIIYKKIQGNTNATGAELAKAQAYYKNLDLSRINTPSSSSNSGGGGIGALGGGLLGTFTKIYDGLSVIEQKAIGSLQSILETQDGGPSSKNGNASTAILDIFKNGGLNPVKLIWESIKTITSEIGSQLKQESDLRYQINKETTLTGELSKDIQMDIIASAAGAERFGMNMEDVGEFYIGLVENSGKFSLINKKLMDDAQPIASVLNKSMKDVGLMVSEFERVGIGASSTLKIIDEVITKEISLGMNAKKVTENIQINIGKLNEYGFKNGVKGLEDMARKAIEFRMEMGSVFSIAEKVFSPEGAIDFTANLQVLGGAIGDFNDPLKLMYMATNNVEGLQDALSGAAKSLATYNVEQGKFEVIGINLRKGKEMANAMGISMGELNKIAVAAAERVQASTALMSRGLILKDKEKEFLTNLSRMEGGEMKITVPQSIADKLGGQLKGVTELSLNKMDQNTANILIDNQKEMAKMSSADIAQNQYTEIRQISNNMNVVAAYIKIKGAQAVRGALDGVGMTKEIKKYLEIAKSEGDLLSMKKTDTKFQGNVKSLVTDIKNDPGKFFKEEVHKAKEQGWKYLGDKFDEGMKNIFSSTNRTNIQFELSTPYNQGGNFKMKKKGEYTTPPQYG